MSLLKLFVGSEGTLGIVTRAILRLIPAQTDRATLVATVGSMTEASQAVVAIGARVRASMMELMHNASINAVEDFKSHGLDRTAGALMIAQSDAPGEARALEIEVMQQACEAAGADEVVVTTDPEDAEMFVSARRIAFVALEAKGTLLLEDVGAPVPLLPDLGRRHRGDRCPPRPAPAVGRTPPIAARPLVPSRRRAPMSAGTVPPNQRDACPAETVGNGVSAGRPGGPDSGPPPGDGDSPAPLTSGIAPDGHLCRSARVLIRHDRGGPVPARQGASLGAAPQ